MAISQAKSIEEIEQLNAMLRSGIIPTHIRQQQPAKKTNGNFIRHIEYYNYTVCLFQTS
jgi:hypothetical protein